MENKRKKEKTNKPLTKNNAFGTLNRLTNELSI